MSVSLRVRVRVRACVRACVSARVSARVRLYLFITRRTSDTWRRVRVAHTL
jgi:hypothetical protein